MRQRSLTEMWPKKKTSQKEGMLGVSGNELSQEHDFEVLSEAESVNEVCNELIHVCIFFTFTRISLMDWGTIHETTEI